MDGCVIDGLDGAGYTRPIAQFAKHTERAAQGVRASESMRIGRQRDMTNEPNLNLLTKAERAEYERYSRLNSLTFREQVRVQARAFVPLIVWGALAIAACINLTLADDAEAAGTGTRSEEAASLVLFLIVLLGGGVGVSVIAKHVTTQGLRHGREALLERIGYADRVKGMSDGEDAYPAPTRRQMQHAWYQGHNELNWRDREHAEMYGMDVDTYINNVLEHDKD